MRNMRYCRTSPSRTGLIAGLLLLSLPVNAQTDPRNTPVPKFNTEDPMGVDLNTGRFNLDSDSISITSAGREVSVVYNNILEVPRLNYEGIFRATTEIDPAGGIVEHMLEIGQTAHIFRTERSGPYIPVSAFTGSLTNYAEGVLYTDIDGTKYFLRYMSIYSTYAISKIEHRDGEIVRYYYKPNTLSPVRVLSNRGWGINRQAGAIKLFNRSVEYCPESDADCTLTGSWPTMTHEVSNNLSTRVISATGYGSITVSKPAPSASSVSFSDGRAPISIQYGSSQGAHAGRVVSISRDNLSRSYTYSYVQNIVSDISLFFINSSGSGGDYKGQVCAGQLVYLDDPNMDRTYLSFDSPFASNVFGCSYSSWDDVSSPPTRYRLPEGNLTTWNYSYWKLGEIIATGKNGAIIKSTRTYLSPHDGPSKIKDEAGNEYEYTYDRGQITSETMPAVGGVRPSKRYSYLQQYARIKDASGNQVQLSEPIWLLASEKLCKTTSTIGNACAGGAADEVSTDYTYGIDLQVHGKSVTADGQTLRTCYAYDAIGNQISETKPRAGLAACP